jgi:hypothetical protein
MAEFTPKFDPPPPHMHTTPTSHYHTQHHSTPAVKADKRYGWPTTWEHYELTAFSGGPFLFHQSYWPDQIPSSSQV